MTRGERLATRETQRIECNSLVLLQVNCRSINNMSSDFWNLIAMYNSNVIVGTESWLKEGISNAEVFRDNYTNFRRDGDTRGSEEFIYVKMTLLAWNHGRTRTLR
jgi:hypothetical protein